MYQNKSACMLTCFSNVQFFVTSVHRILQARVLEWVAMPFSRGSSWPRARTPLMPPALAGFFFFYHWCHLRSPKTSLSADKCPVCAKWLQSCLTLCNTMDCSLPCSSVHGILQARILEWLPCRPPGDLPYPGEEPVSYISCIGRQVTTSATWEAPNAQ